MCIADLFQNKSLAYFSPKLLSNFLAPLCYVTFTMFLKTFEDFLGYENIKKLTSKVAYLILMAVCLFFLCSPDCPKQPRIEYPFYRFLYPMYPMISDLLEFTYEPF
jgi:hypothetical protein